MSTTQSTVREDIFAGPAWNATVTLLALEKLRVGKPVNEDERYSIAQTLSFLRITLATRSMPSMSVLGQELHTIFWQHHVNHSSWLIQLAECLEDIWRRVSGSSEVTDERLLGRVQEQLLDVLITLNRCRSRR